MCGLGGIVLGKKNRTAKSLARIGDVFTGLLLENEQRGPDATGAACMHADGTMDLFKSPMPAHEFVVTSEYSDFLNVALRNDPVVLMGHTRWASQGSPLNNDNNHPVTAGNGVITHNGHIHNAADVMRQFRMKRTAEVDSEVWAHVADRGSKKGVWDMEWMKGAAQRMCGTATVVMASTKAPTTTVIWKGSRPLEFRYSPLYRCVAYASSDAYLRASTDGETWPRVTKMAEWTVTSFQYDSAIHMKQERFCMEGSGSYGVAKTAYTGAAQYCG